MVSEACLGTGSDLKLFWFFFIVLCQLVTKFLYCFHQICNTNTGNELNRKKLENLWLLNFPCNTGDVLTLRDIKLIFFSNVIPRIRIFIKIFLLFS